MSNRSPPPSSTAAATRRLEESPAVQVDIYLNGFSDITASLKKKKTTESNKTGGERMFTPFMSKQIQMQEFQQVMDKDEEEYQKTSLGLDDARDAMRVQYAEFMEVAQSSASYLKKDTSEKKIAALRSRFGNSNAA